VAGITLVSSLCRSCRDPATFNKALVKGFVVFFRLEPSAGTILASCWRNYLLDRSWPPRSDVMAILGMLAGRRLYPWPTQIVIPTTLAPQTGEVLWDNIGLRRVLYLAEVNSRPSKSQGFSSGWKVVYVEVKFRGVSSAISGCAGSRTEPAWGCSAVVSRRPAPWNSCPSKFGPTLPPT
jgi:hypothetical protein